VLWLHGYHTVTHIAAALTQRALRGSRLFREDQTLLSPRARWKTVMKSVGLPCLLGGSFGLFVGTENRRWFARWGVPERRLFHVPYAVDNDALRIAAHDLAPQREQLRAELGIESEAGPVILSLGRLVPKKQPSHLLDAFRQVRTNARCTLLVVGSGLLEKELRQKVAAEAIPDVVFAGFLDQTQIARAYVAADVFALVSSHDETWGLVVNEAMNFGLPIVVSDRVGSASDLVKNGHNGFVVPHDDLAALVAALNRLVMSNDLRMRLGEASRQMISRWTYDVTADCLVAAVRAAVGEPRWALAEASAPEKAVG
jgi:glycosyltransferase involved in cell wall biosynthesis